MYHQGVVAGAVIGAEHIDVWYDGGLISVVTRIGRGDQWRENVAITCAVVTGVAIGAVSMIALFVYEIRADRPMFVEGVLPPSDDVDGLRGLVACPDQIACGRIPACETTCADQFVRSRTAREAARSGGCIGVIDALERGGPAILREVVVEHAKTGADHRLFAASGRVGNPETRCDLLPVIVRNVRCNRNLQRLQSYERIIFSLISTRAFEESKRRLVRK